MEDYSREHNEGEDAIGAEEAPSHDRVSEDAARESSPDASLQIEHPPEQIFFEQARDAWNRALTLAEREGMEEEHLAALQEWERSLRALVGTARNFDTLDLSPEERDELRALTDQMALVLEAETKPADAQIPEYALMVSQAVNAASDFFGRLPEQADHEPVNENSNEGAGVAEAESPAPDVEAAEEHTVERASVVPGEAGLVAELLDESRREEIARKIAEGELTEADVARAADALPVPFATSEGLRALGEEIIGDARLREAAQLFMMPENGGELGIGQLEYFLTEVAQTPRAFEVVCRERRLRIVREIDQRGQEHAPESAVRLGILRERLAAIDAHADAREALERALYGNQYDAWKTFSDLREEVRKRKERAVTVRESIPSDIPLQEEERDFERAEEVVGEILDAGPAVSAEGPVIDVDAMEAESAEPASDTPPAHDSKKPEKPAEPPEPVDEAISAPDASRESRAEDPFFALEPAQIKRINEIRDIQAEIDAAEKRNDAAAVAKLRGDLGRHVKLCEEMLGGISGFDQLYRSIGGDDVAAYEALQAKKRSGGALTPEDEERMKAIGERRNMLIHFMQHKIGIHPDAVRILYGEFAEKARVAEEKDRERAKRAAEKKDGIVTAPASSAAPNPSTTSEPPVVIDLSDMEERDTTGDRAESFKERVRDFFKFWEAEGLHARLEREDAKAVRARAEVVALDHDMDGIRRKIAEIDGTIERIEKERGAMSPKVRLDALRERSALEKELEKLERSRGKKSAILEAANTKKDELRSACLDITNEVAARLNERLSPGEQKLEQARARRDQLEQEQRAFEARRVLWQKEIEELNQFAHQKEYPGKRIEAREKIAVLRERMRMLDHHVASRRDERQKWERSIAKLEKKILPLRERRDAFAALAKREVSDTKRGVAGRAENPVSPTTIPEGVDIGDVRAASEKKEKKISAEAYISAWNTYFGSEAPIREARFRELTKLREGEDHGVKDLEVAARMYFDAEMKAGAEYAPRFLATLDDKLKDVAEYIG